MNGPRLKCAHDRDEQEDEGSGIKDAPESGPRCCPATWSTGSASEKHEPVKQDAIHPDVKHRIKSRLFGELPERGCSCSADRLKDKDHNSKGDRQRDTLDLPKRL